MRKEILGERINHNSYIAQIFLNKSLKQFWTDVPCHVGRNNSIQNFPMLPTFLLVKIFKNNARKRKQSSLKQALLLLVFVVGSLCPTLCDRKSYSIPGFPVLLGLSEFAQTHAHWVGDAIQLSYPLQSVRYNWALEHCQLWVPLEDQPFSCNLISFFFFTLETKIALVVFACESKAH